MDIKEFKTENKNSKQNHPWEYARFEVVHDIIKRNCSGEIKKVYDVGCGDSFFVEKLSQKIINANYVAIDSAFDDNLLQQFSKKYTNKNIQFYKNFDEIDNKENEADIVLLLDVIEHIDNVDEFLKSINEKIVMNENSRLIITVPAYQKLFCSHDQWLGHYRRYNKKLLKQTIQNSGFECIEYGYFFKILLLPRIIKVIKEKIFKPDYTQEKGIGDWHGGKLKSKIIKSILVFDYKISRFFKLLGITIPGLSCYIVCKKQ